MTKITDINRPQARIEAVSKLPAQYASLCQLTTKHESLLNVVVSAIMNEKGLRVNECMMLDLMLSGGLRVSELLQDNCIKVNRLGQVYIRGLKGSSDKLVTPIYYKSFWQKYKPSQTSPFMHISRFSFYKWCRSIGIVLKHKGKENNSVTHAMRHLHVYLMELMDIPEKDLSLILGHKSLRNLKYYSSGR